jgi:integrase
MHSMMGHLNQVIQIFDYRSGNALLKVMGRAIRRRTPTPSRRYDTIWDINTLLEWIQRNWSDNDGLPLSDLLCKSMLIVMIFSACRLAELGRMERPSDPEVQEDTIILKTITKQRQDTKQQIIMRRITLAALCPVETVQAWLRRTSPQDHGRLFFLVQDRIQTGSQPATGRELKSVDICSRFLRIMRSADIPSHYTAYSIKHAVVTRLFQLGATDEQIGAYGHWAPGSRTAQRWYNIATLDKDWLGTKLVGQWLHTHPVKTLEDFDNQYMPTCRTHEQAETRTRAVETLVLTSSHDVKDRTQRAKRRE